MPSWREMYAGMAAMLTACAASASAQAAAPLLRPRLDSAVHRLPIDATRIQPRQLVYAATTHIDTTMSSAADVRVQLIETQYAGSAAWLLVETGAKGIASASDTLLISRSDLRPLHWIASLGVARLAAEFTADSIFGAMSSPGGRLNIVLANRPDLLVNTTSLYAVLTALPLQMGWSDSATVLVIDGSGAAIASAMLTVESEEHVSTAAGDYDCWVVSLESERASARFWVAKSEPLVVRSEQPLPQLGGALLERTLLRVEIPQSPSTPNVPPLTARVPRGRR